MVNINAGIFSESGQMGVGWLCVTIGVPFFQLIDVPYPDLAYFFVFARFPNAH